MIKFGSKQKSKSMSQHLPNPPPSFELKLLLLPQQGTSTKQDSKVVAKDSNDGKKSTLNTQDISSTNSKVSKNKDLRRKDQEVSTNPSVNENEGGHRKRNDRGIDKIQNKMEHFGIGTPITPSLPPAPPSDDDIRGVTTNSNRGGRGRGDRGGRDGRISRGNIGGRSTKVDQSIDHSTEDSLQSQKSEEVNNHTGRVGGRGSRGRSGGRESSQDSSNHEIIDKRSHNRGGDSGRGSRGERGGRSRGGQRGREERSNAVDEKYLKQSQRMKIPKTNLRKSRTPKISLQQQVQQ